MKIFRSASEALVVGNLYDPACSYTWSNKMRESLPDSVMMVWQGAMVQSSFTGGFCTILCWIY